jgi:hypothetical protein
VIDSKPVTFIQLPRKPADFAACALCRFEPMGVTATALIRRTGKCVTGDTASYRPAPNNRDAG